MIDSNNELILFEHPDFSFQNHKLVVNSNIIINEN